MHTRNCLYSFLSNGKEVEGAPGFSNQLILILAAKVRHPRAMLAMTTRNEGTNASLS